MADIPCRRCDSPDCKGCNIYTLATALQQGKFEPLMDENRTVHVAASVRENVTIRTRGDAIRAMSDEELAEWLDRNFGFADWCKEDPCSDCRKCVLDWLKSGVEE